MSTPGTVQVKYIYPSGVVESHVQDERGPTMMFTSNQGTEVKEVTARGSQPMDVMPGGKTKGLVTSHRERNARNHVRVIIT